MRRTLAVRRIAWTVLLLLCWSGCHAQSAVQEVPFETALASMPPEELGDLLMNQHRYVEAMYVYSGGPMNAVLWNKAGIAWHHLLAIGKARSNYQRALQLDPNYADALNNLGATYFAERKYKTAIHYYQRALALAPRSAVYLVNLGTAYFAEGKTARGRGLSQGVCARRRSLRSEESANRAGWDRRSRTRLHRLLHCRTARRQRPSGSCLTLAPESHQRGIQGSTPPDREQSFCGSPRDAGVRRSAG